METFTAIPVYNNRVSPLFDTAGKFKIYKIYSGKILSSYIINSCDEPGNLKIDKLTSEGVSTIICAAISRIFADYIDTKKIELIPGVCGNVHEVIEAYISNSLITELFSMPGCRWMNKYRSGQCPRYREIVTSTNKGRKT